MKTIFADFQSKGVNEFVLDLRYNGGGYEHSANMLAGLLISEEYKDKVFGIFSNNKGKVTHTRYFNTETGGTTGYLKLNSNRIYILTSENTASSSELVISSLEPFMNIILIGELTEGKMSECRSIQMINMNGRIGLLLQKLPMLYIQTIVPDLPPITIGTSLI